MFDDLVTDLDRDQSPAFVQFGRAVLADVSPMISTTSPTPTSQLGRALFAALEAGRSVVVSNDNALTHPSSSSRGMAPPRRVDRPRPRRTDRSPPLPNARRG